MAGILMLIRKPSCFAGRLTNLYSADAECDYVLYLPNVLFPRATSQVTVCGGYWTKNKKGRSGKCSRFIT